MKLLQDLHKRDIIYNYWVPEHICVSDQINNSKLYVVNFINAVKRKIINDESKAFQISKFSALNNHLGIFPSYRDDIEAVIYLLIYFFKKGKFLESQNLEDIKTFKMNFYAETLVGEIPQELIVVFNYAKSLSFDDKPYYAYIFTQFEQYFTKYPSKTGEYEYDWIDQIKRKALSGKLSDEMYSRKRTISDKDKRVI